MIFGSGSSRAYHKCRSPLPSFENIDMSNEKCGQNPHGRKLKVFSVKLRYVRVNWCLTLNFVWDDSMAHRVMHD